MARGRVPLKFCIRTDKSKVQIGEDILVDLAELTRTTSCVEGS